MKDTQREKEYTEGIAIKGGFLGWLDNYWYHYKWVTIGVAFFLVVAIICIAQSCNKEKDDLILLYAGPNQLSVAEADKVSSALEAIMPEDFDGDGRKSVGLSLYNILSAEQLEAIKSETDAEGKHVFVDNTRNSSQYDTYYDYLMTGETSVIMVDPWLYESLLTAGRLANVKETLGYMPESACSEYGVTLGNTEFYKSYGVMQLLPDDTVVCLLKPYVFGKNSDQEHYEHEKEMFKAIVSYGNNGTAQN